MSKTKLTLGAVLRSAREKRGLSLRELGKLTRTDHAYIHRLEIGDKKSPSTAKLFLLSRVLRMPKKQARVFFFLSGAFDLTVDRRRCRELGEALDAVEAGESQG